MFDFEKWVEENGTNIERKYINGTAWDFITMNDGWIAVFEVNDVTKERYPTIQAKDMAHAESYCNMCENLPFAVNIL